MASPLKNILSDDFAKNTKQIFTGVTSFSLSVRIGMWGADMFGSLTILGAGQTVTYLKEKKNTIVSGSYMRLNTIQV